MNCGVSNRKANDNGSGRRFYHLVSTLALLVLKQLGTMMGRYRGMLPEPSGFCILGQCA